MSNSQPTQLEAMVQRGHRLGYDVLTQAEQVVFHITNCDTEISMSGVSGYLHTHYADCASQAVEALVKIGALKSAEILRRACALFPSGVPPTDTEARRERLAEFTEEQLAELDSLDRDYQARPDDLGDKFEAFFKNRVIAKQAPDA